MDNQKSLHVVEYAEKASQILRDLRPAYSRSAMNFITYIERAFDNDEEMIGITHRIKTEASLKEKIYRKGLYKLYGERELFAHISDIVGVKIECRFLENEKDIYKKLKSIFCVHEEGLYYKAKDNDDIFLKMGSTQPEKQKNDYNIYRLDGYVKNGEQRFRFEVQIKSLVNSFWSEIEHKIIYKNKKYMLIDSFITELMGSIHDNLENIDRQLDMLYHRALDSTSDSFFHQNKSMLAMILNTVYSQMAEKKLGFAINIKDHSEMLVNYIMADSTFLGDGAEYGGLIVKLINRVRDLRETDIALGEKLDINANVFDNGTPLEKALANKIASTVNDDFYVNTFFHILCHVEIGKPSEDFKRFITYYASCISKGKNKKDTEQLINKINDMPTQDLLKEEYMSRLIKRS